MEEATRLSSWIFWKKYLEKYPDTLPGYKFPQSAMVFHNLYNGSCPIGSDLTWDTPKRRIYCICSMLDWLGKQHLETAGIEIPIAPASLDDLRNSKGYGDLIKDVRKFIDNPREWMVIQGGNGIGKTHILRAIKTELGGLALFISTDRLQQKLFSAQNKDDEVQRLIDTISTVPVLLLDDWGLEHRSSWTTDTIASIINRRYMFPRDLPTIVTTNSQMEYLAASPDLATKRIASRLLDVNIAQWYTVVMDDHRVPDEVNNIIRNNTAAKTWKEGR